jgi:hypothetical protein
MFAATAAARCFVHNTPQEVLLQGLGPAAVSAAVRQTRVLQDLNVTADALLRVVSVVSQSVALQQGMFLNLQGSTVISGQLAGCRWRVVVWVQSCAQTRQMCRHAWPSAHTPFATPEACVFLRLLLLSGRPSAGHPAQCRDLPAASD